MDHIHGGGYRHGKELGSSGKLYKWLVDNHFPDGFRVLCANCNMRAARNVPFPNAGQSTGRQMLLGRFGS
jgi:hypothetical protein